jgi:hypothetical protein
MKRNTIEMIMLTFFLTLALGAARHAQAQDGAYPTSMAPLDQYLMDRDAEIALARSAAPPSVAKDAAVMVLGRQGYETAVEGTNGFVCLVHRSWTDKVDDSEFWNPKRRGPMCLNAAAARSFLPNAIMRTNLVLAGRSKAQIFEALNAAYDKKELPTIESGAMCYMLAKQGHLSDRDGHWHPHLMFFFPPKEAPVWGANLPGSPVLAGDNDADRMTVFVIRVGNWSDGTSDTDDGH